MDLHTKVSFRQQLRKIQEAVREADPITREDNIGNTMQLPLSWLEQAWKNPENRQSMCEHQQLPIGFIAERWLKMTALEQRACCIHQEFTTQFIKGFWIHMSFARRDMCCDHQSIPTELMKEQWASMHEWQKEKCTWRQQFFNQLPPGELPEFLTSDNWRIRRAAAKSMTKYAREGAQRD